MSIASCTSPRVSARTFPISRVMSFEKSSLCATIDSAARYKISARLGAGTRRHFLYACLAASTAASTSSDVEDTNIPTSSSVFAGLRFSYAFPLRDSTHSPLMKFLYTRGAGTVAILPPQTLELCLYSLRVQRGICRWKLKFIAPAHHRQTWPIDHLSNLPASR